MELDSEELLLTQLSNKSKTLTFDMFITVPDETKYLLLELAMDKKIKIQRKETRKK